MGSYWWRVVSRAWSWTGGLFGGAQNPFILFTLAALPPAAKWYQLGRQASVGAVLGDPVGWCGAALAAFLFIVGILRAAPKIYAEQERRLAEAKQQIEGMRLKRLTILYNESDGVYLSDIPVLSVSVRLFRVGVRNDSERTIDDLGLNLSGDPEWATAIVIAERPIPLQMTDANGPLNPGLVRLFDVAQVRRIALVAEQNSIDLCVADGFPATTFSCRTYGIILTAHGRDVAPTTVRALIQTTPGETEQEIVFRAWGNDA